MSVVNASEALPELATGAYDYDVDDHLLCYLDCYCCLNDHEDEDRGGDTCLYLWFHGGGTGYVGRDIEPHIATRISKSVMIISKNKTKNNNNNNI